MGKTHDQGEQCVQSTECRAQQALGSREGSGRWGASEGERTGQALGEGSGRNRGLDEAHPALASSVTLSRSLLCSGGRCPLCITCSSPQDHRHLEQLEVSPPTRLDLQRRMLRVAISPPEPEPPSCTSGEDLWVPCWQVAQFCSWWHFGLWRLGSRATRVHCADSSNALLGELGTLASCHMNRRLS